MEGADGPRARLPLIAVLGAYVVSVTCTAVSAIAIPWLVLSTTGSATATGFAVAAEMAPYVVMQAVGGPWVERIGPRRVSWVANLAAGLALLLIPLLHVTGGLGYTTLLLVIALVGALRGLADCGSAPLVPGTATLARTPLERAAGLHASANQAGFLVGAPLGGVLLAVLPAPVVLVVSGLGFLVASALVRFAVPAQVGGGARGDTEPYLRRIAAGVAFLAREPVLRAVVAMTAVTNVLSSGYVTVLLPSWARDGGLEPSAVGVVAASQGLGALCGSLLGAWLVPRLDRWAVFAVGFLLGGPTLMLGLLLTDSVAPAVAATFGAGLMAGGLNPVIGAVQYERVPEPMLPRVLGTTKSIAWAGIPLGPVLAGLLVDASGVRTALGVLAIAIGVAALAPFLAPVFRGLRRPAPA